MVNSIIFGGLLIMALIAVFVAVVAPKGDDHVVSDESKREVERMGRGTEEGMARNEADGWYDAYNAETWDKDADDPNVWVQ